MTTTTIPRQQKQQDVQRKQRIKAVLFDLDGTLLDTEALSDQAILAAFGPSLPRSIRDGRLPWEIKRQILGLRGAEWIPMVLSYAQENWGVSTPLCVQEFWSAWEENLNNFCDEIASCPGALELVRALKNAGLPLAIATSSRQDSVDKKRRNHEDLFGAITTVVAGDDPALKNGKPAPDIYLEAALRLGVDPTECLVFEDAISGVKAGKAAGCVVVAVPDPRFEETSRAEVFGSVADLVLDDLWQFCGTEWGVDVDMPSLRANQESSEIKRTK